MFELLLVLVRNHGRIVDKDFLLKAVWPDSFVEEGNISFNIRQLRKTFDDDAQAPSYIETIPRRGYRFVAKVEEVPAEAVSENGGDPAAVQAAEISTQRFKRLTLPIAAGFVLLTGAIVIGTWFVRSKDSNVAPILSTPFASEKLSTNGKAFAAAISPDGMTVVYTDRNAGRESVWIRQLESANNVEIIPPSDATYHEFVFSPDAAFLYFTRRAKRSELQSDIYRVSIFGGIPTKIAGETQGWVSLSRDGEKISFIRCHYRDDEYCSLWIADDDGKNERKLVSRPRPIRIADNEISPDGKTIVFAVGQSRNAANEFALYEVDIESGVERELSTERFFNIKHLVWLSNQSGLLMTAARIPNKHFRIWHVSAASGEAQPLTRDSETYSVLSLDKEASKIVTTQIKEDFRLSLYRMENPAVSRILTEGTRLTFAPDGKILFSSMMSDNNEIWRMSADGGERRQLTNDAADDTLPIVSPDNNSVFFVSNRTGEAHIWRMDMDGSNQTQITHKEGGFPFFASPDGNWLYYNHGLHRTLWRVSLKSGEEQLIWDRAKDLFAFAPDGSRFAFPEKQGDENVLVIASLMDRQTVRTIRFPDPKARMLDLKWLPDGSSLAYILSNNDYEQNALWLQPLDAEKPRKIIDLGDDEVSHFAVAPDGKSFAVAQGGWKHDAVLLKGLR